MKTQEVSIKPHLKITMTTDSEILQEVVVTGMQRMDKRLFTGAATKLSADNVKLDGMAEISRSLEGRAAGVSVQNVSGTFGTAPKIRVRGATSIYGSSKPLWVVDGVIMEDVTEVGADNLSSGDAVTLISSAIAGLNADDIESFQILKDGSATSIYGARAMAGVIVVTTKKGKAGSNKISYTGEFSMRLKPNYNDFNIMNSQEQMDVYKTMASNGYLNFSDVYRASDSGVYGKMYHLTNDYSNDGFALANTLEARNQYLQLAEYRNTDWFDILFNNSISQNHAISMSSGTDKASYYTSLSAMTDPGWTKQSSVQRYTANINALYNISRQLSLNLIGSTSYRKQKAPGTLSSSIDVVSGEVRRDFDINPYSYALNTSRALDANEYYVRNYAPFNILHELDNNNMDLSVIDLKFQGELKWKPFRKVELAALGAYKHSSTTQSHSITDYSNQAWAYRAMDDATMRDANPWLYTDPDVANSLPLSVLPVGGFYRETKYGMNSYDFRGTISYNDVFAEDHVINLFGGMQLTATDRSKTWFNGVGMQYDMGMLPSYDYMFFKQGKEENTQYYTVEETRSREVAFFATGTYSYKGRYTVNGTIRYEGSNKLGKSRSSRWLPTWNLSGAWNMHEEAFFEDLKPALSNLTLRASYSLTADRGPANVTNSHVVIGSYNPYRPFASVGESGLEIKDLENSELTYEKKHEFNLGVDIGFLDNRINLVVDWYKRNNYDLIGMINTMGVGGQISKYANVASMRSHGIEFTLSTRNIATKKFKWNTDFIISHAKNTVTELDSQSRVIDMISGAGFALQGYPVRSLFSMDFRGLNTNGVPTFINEKGELTTSDINFQERINKDHLIYEGPTDPTITGSFGNMFTYKGFKLNVFITYSFGNVVRLDPVFSNKYSDLDAMPKEFKNRWTLTGDENTTNVPVIADRRMNQKDPNLKRAYNAYNYSTERIAKGDFIRMKEISISYDFPKIWISHLKLSDLSLKLQATNLFLIYSDDKLNGQDPEFFNTGGVAAPVPKQFTLTLRMGI
ncbi:SusC/RagA family TonB-linked outer membrane protein [Bacteroides cellulosilyticus]|nr:SusC/RagA family TonB-linked outer membrane protein [Bacteroides cellulosilyticus]MBV3663963.1 SusC/RagA family TonB-linked outer membrane protein [Bacteroides cellulosilyticus]MBV3685902.1 SusC/RagA family TonB-linked outer membrane protein [Bacteroides cellulosilyticus]MBV3694944.1 SusC/RagA family TonB-linked outer membrane protein [Bacteroides cellulosilyticus]MBV3708199.1 SusC/RagA family TonB-linked outer membrane protein [Bacteroides cellulosilyticus]